MFAGAQETDDFESESEPGQPVPCNPSPRSHETYTQSWQQRSFTWLRCGVASTCGVFVLLLFPANRRRYVLMIIVQCGDKMACRGIGMSTSTTYEVAHLEPNPSLFNLSWFTDVLVLAFSLLLQFLETASRKWKQIASTRSAVLLPHLAIALLLIFQMLST